MKKTIHKLSGILFALIIAIPAWLIGNTFPIIGSPVLGILFGMILAFWKRPSYLDSSITFTAKKLLQYSIILMGFGMNLFNVFKVGKFAIVMAMVSVGLNTNIVQLIKNGVKPILLGFTCWVVLALTSLGVQHFIMGIF
jgi:uncharacterized membrane protein YadS